MDEVRYNPDEKVITDEILLAMPGVKVGKAFGHPAYKVNGKVFAFLLNHAITIKLPEPRVSDLIASDPAFKPFGPTADIIWKAWLKIEPDSPDKYESYEPLFIESMQFVAES